MTTILIDKGIFADWTLSLSEMQQQITDDASGTIKVQIHSFGGSVADGIAIYNLLKGSGKNIVTEALGAVYSAATLVFLAGHERIMKVGAQLMIHDPSIFADLTESAFEELKTLLNGVKEQILDIYEKETTASRDELSQLMSDESYLSGKRAVELGFATEFEKANLLENIKNFLGIKPVTNMEEIQKITAELEASKTLNDSLAAQVKNCEQQASDAQVKATDLESKIAELEQQLADAKAETVAKQAEVDAQAEQLKETIKNMGLDPNGQAEKLAAKNSQERLNVLRNLKTTKERLEFLNQNK